MSTADRPSTPSTPSSAGGGGGGGKLESLCKEDVIKFAKRQTMLLSKAKAKIDELSKKGEPMENFNALRNEKAGILEELKVSREQKEQLQQELDDVKDKLDQTRSRYAEVEEERLSAVAGYRALQNTLEQSETNKSNTVRCLEEEVEKLSSQLRSLQEENECLKMQHTSTLDSVKAIQLEYQTVVTEKLTLAAQHVAVAAELAEANRVKEKLMVNFKALKQKYLEMKKDFESKMSNQNSDSAAAADECEQYRSQVELCKSRNSEQSESLTQLQSRYESQQSQYESLQSQYESLQSDYKQQTETLTKALTDSGALTTSLEQQETDNSVLRERLDELVEREKGDERGTYPEMIAKHEAEISEWKDRMESMKSSYEETIRDNQGEITDLKEEIKQLTDVQSDSKLRVEELVLGLGKESAGIISEYEMKISDYEVERGGLLKRIEELSSQPQKETETASNQSGDVDQSSVPNQIDCDTTTESTNPDAPPAKSANQEIEVEEVITPQSASLVEGGMVAPITEKDALWSNLCEELEQEKQLTKSLQEMMTTLTDTLGEFEKENKLLRAQVERSASMSSPGAHSADMVAKVKERSASMSSPGAHSADMVAKVKEMEKSLAEKDEQVESFGSKLAELVNYTSRLKTKCKMIVDANDQLTVTVEQLERKIQNDARGARNIQLHFQETENNVNEQIAHFHEQRDEMIAQVQDYAASIETLRVQMQPYRTNQKECALVLYKGLCSLADHCDNLDNPPQSGIVDMAALLVNTAGKLKGRYIILLHQHDKMHKAEASLKRIALNWRWRFEEEFNQTLKLKKTISQHEKTILELGGSADIAEELLREVQANEFALQTEPIDSEELETVTDKFKEEELNRLYKEQDKYDRQISLLKKELSDKIDMIIMLKADQAEQAEMVSADADVRPKVRAGHPPAPETSLVSATTQTEETETISGSSEKLEAQKEIIESLRLELSEQTKSINELQPDDRVDDLNRSLDEATTQLSAKDREIELLNATVTRLKSQLDHQADSLVNLKIQLCKNKIQEKFSLQVVDTRGAEVQAALATSMLDLKNSNDEKEVLIAQIEQLKADAASNSDEQISMKKQQISRMQVLMEDLVTEKMQLEDANLEVNKRNEMLGEEINTLTASCEKLSVELGEVKNQMSEKSSHASAVPDETCAVETPSKDMLVDTSAHVAVDDETAESESVNASVVAQAKSEVLQLDKEALERNLEMLETEIVKQTEMVEVLQKERDSLHSQVQTLQEKESSSDKNILITVALKAESESQLLRISELEEELKQRHLAVEDYQTQCSQLGQQVEELEEEVLSQRLKVENSLRKVEENTSKSNELKEELVGKCAEVSVLEQRVEVLEVAASEAEVNAQRLRDGTARATVQLEQMQLQNEDLQDRIKDMEKLRKSESSDSKSIAENLLVDRDNLEDTVNEKSQQLMEVSNQLEDLQERYDQEKLGIDEKESEVTSLNQKVCSSAEELERSASEVGKLTEEIERLNNEVMQFHDKAEKERVDLQLELQSLKSEIVTKAAENEGFVKEMEGLEEENNRLFEFSQTNEQLLVQAEGQQVEIERLSQLTEDLQKEVNIARREVMESSMSSQTSAVSEEQGLDNPSAVKLKEMEERANKFKLLALKAKKELIESRNQVEKLKAELQDKSTNKVGEMKTLVNNYQHLQEDLDRLQDDLDSERAKVTALQAQVESEQTTSNQLQSRLGSVMEEKENVVQNNSQLLGKIKVYETQMTDWKTKILALEKDLDARQVEVCDLNRNMSRLMEQLKSNEGSSKTLEDRLRAKISELEVKVHEARDELEQANKTVSKSSVMHLEIADFERTVSSLQAEVKDKYDIMNNLQQELEHQQQKCSSLESELASADEQRKSVESRSDKLQQIINKTKDELDQAKQQENESKTTDLAMRGELECLRQQHEDLKLEMSRISSGRLVVEDKMKSSQESQHRLIRSMENKQRALQSDLESSRSELTLLQQEYDGYKVRVHSVLKQQQTKATVEAALESEKVEKNHLQEVLNQVKIKLQETSEKLQASLAETGLLQEELDKLSLRHNKATQDFTNKEAVWRQRLDQLMAENSTIASEHSSAISQMTQHTDVMTMTFKEQMRASQTEHDIQLTNLNNRVERLEDEKASLVGEVQNLRRQIGSVKHEQVKPSRQHSRQQASSPVLASDAKYNVRESGEGMEHPQPLQIPPNPSTHPQVAPNTLQGLESLLSSALPDEDTASVVSLNTQISEGVDDSKLKSKLQLSEKQLEHLRELLNESEATCLRYNEQVKILKQEIRRLESNQQRENSISNMEYLKNIVYKFLSLEAGDERARLLPVLHTMLKFTDDELSALRALATSDTDTDVAGQSQGSWSGYLHKWTGFS